MPGGAIKKLAIFCSIPTTTIVIAKANLLYQEQKCDLPKRRIPVNGNKEERKAIIIGAGVAGITSAYQLAKRDFKVTVVDFSDSPGSQCSAVPAGAMQRDNSFVNRKSWLAVIKSWNPYNRDEFPFFHIKWSKTLTDPHFLRWMLHFTYYSVFEPSSQEFIKSELTEFTLYALKEMHNFIETENMGELIGLNKQGAIDIKTKTEMDQPKGLQMLEPTENLNEEQILQLEPSLKKWNNPVLWAKFETETSAANCESFTKLLAEKCEKQGVKFITNTNVKEIQLDGDTNRISLIKSSIGELEVDENTEIVIASGSWTPKLLWTCGYFAPIYPMKGYCVAMNIPDKDLHNCPNRIIIDKKTFISRLGQQVRVTSIGEFCGWDTKPDYEVDRLFRMEGRNHVPGLESIFDETPTRCGLRPMVADGTLLIGRIDGIENLSVNVGPGFNGWKVSFGSADVLARVLANQSNQDLKFDCDVLSPKKRVFSSPIWSMLSLSRWS